MDLRLFCITAFFVAAWAMVGNPGVCGAVFDPSAYSVGSQFVKTVLDPGSYAYAPSIMLDNGVYKMWYCGFGTGYLGTGDNIFYATSLDGYNWSNPKSVLGTTVAPEGKDACDPSVVKVNGTYYLYYTSQQPQCGNGNGNQIFLATSTDGMSWSKHPSNSNPLPVIKCAASNSCSSYCVGQSSVIYKDNEFIHYYTDTSKANCSCVYAASSSDGINFQPLNGGNIVYSAGGSVDVKYVPDLSIYFLVHGGNANEPKKYWSVSADGTNWGPSSSDALAIAVNKPCTSNPGLLGTPTGMMSEKSTVYYGAGTLGDSNAPATYSNCFNSSWRIDATDITLTQQICAPNAISGCKVCSANGVAWVDMDSRCAQNQKCVTGNCFDPLTSLPQSAVSVAIKANINNGYVCAENAGASPLIANRSSVGPWETFDLFPQSDGTAVFRSQANSKYVTAENAGASPLIADRDAIGPWEKFTIADAGSGYVNLKASVNNGYVTAENAGASPLIANRTVAGTWEKFLIIPVSTTSCQSQCSSGAKQCNSTTGYQICGDANSDGCLEWGSVTACASGQTCSGGTCVSTCVPKTCGQLNYYCGPADDGCGGALSCGGCLSNQTCDNGICINNPSPNPVLNPSPNPSPNFNPNPNSTPTINKPVAQMTRAEILAKIAQIKKLLIQLIQQLIVELQKQLLSMGAG